jgi:hypothetical protein
LTILFHVLTFSANALNRFLILFVGHKLPIKQVNPAGRIIEHTGIVGGNNNGFAGFTELFKQLHDHDAALGIKVTGGLIRKD